MISDAHIRARRAESIAKTLKIAQQEEFAEACSRWMRLSGNAFFTPPSALPGVTFILTSDGKTVSRGYSAVGDVVQAALLAFRGLS